MSIEYLMPYLAIAIYLLGTLWVGLAGYQKEQNTVEGYFLADRKINPIVLFFTLSATNFSAFFFLGFAGSGYRIGLSYYPMMAFDTGLAALGFYYIGYKVWQYGKKKGLITPPELIDVCFHSKALKLLVMAVMVIFTLPYLTLQPIGAGYLLSTLTNGQIPYFLGATLLTLIIVFYVCVGGMKSVALTDIWQGVLMFVLMIAALVAIAHGLGGFATANSNVYEISPELFSRQGVDNFFTPKKLFSYIILWNLALMMLPQMFMRFYAAKNANSLKVSTVLYPIVTILFICPVMIGMWGHIAFPDLVGKEADQILPMMLEKYAPIWLSSFVMVGGLGSIYVNNGFPVVGDQFNADAGYLHLLLPEKCFPQRTNPCRPSADCFSSHHWFDPRLQTASFNLGLRHPSLYGIIGTIPDGNCCLIWQKHSPPELYHLHCSGRTGSAGLSIGSASAKLDLWFSSSCPDRRSFGADYYPGKSDR